MTFNENDKNQSPRVAFLWPLLPGYLAPVVTRLVHDFGYHVKIFALGNDGVNESDAFVEADLFRNVDVQLWDRKTIANLQHVRDDVAAYRPDILVVSGWYFRSYAQFYRLAEFSGIPIVLAIDNTFQGTWKQWVGKFALQRILRRANRIMVPGDRGSELMKYWGVPAEKVQRGLYSFGFSGFENAGQQRAKLGETPKRFLFVGRLCERKGIDLLVAAYASYRSKVSDPWELVVCGRGPLDNLCRSAGIAFRGFTEYSALPEVMSQCSVFVFPSLHDSWGVALAEACAAGMPVVCTSNCGASADLVCDGYNGFVIPSGSSVEIERTLHWFHSHREAIPDMGRRSVTYAEGYSDHAASQQWHRMFGELVGARPDS